MRRITFLLLIVALAGCKGTTGPLASRQREQKTDPLLNSEEQQRANRERYPLYADDPTVAPPTFNTGAGPTGR